MLTPPKLRRSWVELGSTLLLVTACSSGPSTPYNSWQVAGDSQFFVHPTTHMPEVMGVAQRYCAERGKTAVVHHQSPYGPDGLRQTQVLCR